MTTHIESPAMREPIALDNHWLWLAGGLVYAFAVPFVFTDLLDLPRDVYYGLYFSAIGGLFCAWLRATGKSARELLRHRWRWGALLGIAFAAVLALMVVQTEESSSRPDTLELVAAVVWRGMLYGLADGLLLSVFPILVVFAAFERSPRLRTWPGRIGVGLVALLASMAITATYHLGYSDFRSTKLRKPVAGDVIWSAPTLVTLNPLGAPIAHAGLHTSAVLHSYKTETYLPPHDGG